MTGRDESLQRDENRLVEAALPWHTGYCMGGSAARPLSPTGCFP